MFDKSKNKKRSPLKKESLRQAGQSLSEKFDDIFSMEIFFPLVAILFLLFSVIATWVMDYFKIENNPLAHTIGSLLIIIYFVAKIIKGANKIKNIKLGRDGEIQVAEVLEELKIFGYKVFNDILEKEFNIDHVVIGPAGVFTIETKTYRKQNGADYQIHYDGTNLKIDGFSSIKKDPIKQAIGQMYWLKGFIENSAKINITVNPVIVFPGWFIDSKNNNSDIVVTNEKLLVLKIKNAQTVLNQDQINLISSHLEIYIRNN